MRTAIAATIALGLLQQAAFASELSEAQQRGKQIYFEGTSPRGTEITAVVGDEAALLPGSAMPCSSCHGSDGLGRPEGGVIPLDIRWSELVKSYGHVHHDDRRHPPFDDDSFIRSMIAGVDPANNPMDRSMPLYQMSGEDMADLVAYMKVLEHDLDPGVENDAVRVATLLPLNGRAAGTGDAMRRVLEGYFNDVNEKGGVFGRRIELLTVPMAESADGTLATLREAFDAEGVFALVGAYTIGLDEVLLDFLRSDNIPLVGPFTLDPGDAFIDSAAFYLYSGLDQQARVLADLALLQRAGAGQVAIVAPEGQRADRLARSANDQLRKKGADDSSLTARYEPAALDAGALAARVADAEALLFLGAHGDLQNMLTALADSGIAPRVYVLSSSLVQPLFNVPAVFDQRIFIAYPTLSSDISPKGRQEYQQLVETYSLTREHVQAQLAAFAAGKLLVEGLRRAGRDLSRIRLVDGLEELYEYKTGVAPPLTYGPNRRIGALGAHIVAVDLENKRYAPVGEGWQELR